MLHVTLYLMYVNVVEGGPKEKINLCDVMDAMDAMDAMRWFLFIGNRSHGCMPKNVQGNMHHATAKGLNACHGIDETCEDVCRQTRPTVHQPFREHDPMQH